MPIKSKADLLTAQNQYLNGQFVDVPTVADGNGIEYPQNVATASFKREEVLALVNSLDTEYISVFLIKKTNTNGAVISMAMAGANEIFEMELVNVNNAELINLGGITDQGIIATKECPPHCSGAPAPMGLVHLAANDS